MGWYDTVQVQAPTGQGYMGASQLLNQSAQNIKDATREGASFFASQAIKDLMKTAPTGTQDPTAHIANVNRLIGYMTPEQAQAYRDSNAAMQQSYGRALEQDRFQKNFDQVDKQFKDKMTFEDKKLLAEQIMAKDKIAAQLKSAQISSAPAWANARLNAEQFQFNKGLKQAQAEAEGFEIGNDGKMTYNPESAKALMNIDSKIRDTASKFKADKFLDTANSRSAFWGLTVNNNNALNRFSEAMQFINTPTKDKKTISDKSQLLGMVESGDYENIEKFLSGLRTKK